VRELVAWLLESTPGWSRDRVDDVLAGGERLDVALGANVPIYTVYVTAWATAEGVVNFRSDIYGRDGLA
jgi:murein L,D-transpeptidase YcbB/YkuD